MSTRYREPNSFFFVLWQMSLFFIRRIFLIFFYRLHNFYHFLKIKYSLKIKIKYEYKLEKIRQCIIIFESISIITWTFGFSLVAVADADSVSENDADDVATSVVKFSFGLLPSTMLLFSVSIIWAWPFAMASLECPFCVMALWVDSWWIIKTF